MTLIRAWTNRRRAGAARTRLAGIPQSARIAIGACGAVRLAAARVGRHGQESQIIDEIGARGRHLNVQHDGDGKVGVSRVEQPGYLRVREGEVNAIPDVERLARQLDLRQELTEDTPRWAV